MFEKFSGCLVFSLLMGWIPASAGARDRIEATLDAYYAQGILTGTFVKAGEDTGHYQGVPYSIPWRMIKVDQWLNYPFLEIKGPDTLKIMRTPGRLDSLVNGTPYLIYLSILMDAGYGFTLHPGSPVQPLSESGTELSIAKQVVKSKPGMGDWGILEDTVRASDSVVFLNFHRDPDFFEGDVVLYSNGKVTLDCPMGGEGLVNFTSISAEGTRTRHTMFKDAINPPLAVPYYGGILLTEFSVVEANQSCGPRTSSEAPKGAVVTFSFDYQTDSLVFRGQVGEIWVDGLQRRTASLQSGARKQRSDAGIDAMGRFVPGQPIRKSMVPNWWNPIDVAR